MSLHKLHLQIYIYFHIKGKIQGQSRIALQRNKAIDLKDSVTVFLVLIGRTTGCILNHLGTILTH